MANLLRIAGAVIIAVLVWAALVGVLLLLPPSFAVATMFCGLVLFLVGAKLHLRWPVALGGVLIFGGVFAAALLGGLK
jgi:hypothetical protein